MLECGQQKKKYVGGGIVRKKNMLGSEKNRWGRPGVVIFFHFAPSHLAQLEKISRFSPLFLVFSFSPVICEQILKIYRFGQHKHRNLQKKSRKC